MDEEDDDRVNVMVVSEESVENVYLENHLRIEVILDSGADVSLLPLRPSPGRAMNNKKNNTRLQDAQETTSLVLESSWSAKIFPLLYFFLCLENFFLLDLCL